MSEAPPPLVLVILDGFGEAPASTANAVSLAQPQFLTGLRERYPFTLIDASGLQVGLPRGLMGNSEVGHINIGAGRIVYQDLTRIDESIASGEFFTNQALVGAVEHATCGGSTLHLIGLVSDGGVHSSDRHLEALLEVARRGGLTSDRVVVHAFLDGGVHSSDRHLEALLEVARRGGLTSDRVVVHAFLDGRDTPPDSAATYVDHAEAGMASRGVGRIATVVGRYYAMDRDERWERVQRAYDALTQGIGETADSALGAVQAAHARGEADEFVLPTVIGSRDSGRIRDGDAVIFFNFRADRARQLTDAFINKDFAGFDRRATPSVHFVAMTRYREDLECPAAFEPMHVEGTFAQVVSDAGLSQLRIAETEKYAHVTFFFSGGDEGELPGERRIFVPSPKVSTYDKKPEMAADEVTARLLAELDRPDRPALTILNFANADMVGHTGVIPAAVEAVRVLDRCLAAIVPKVTSLGGTVAITADHGNCEQMRDPKTGKPHTAHTTNPIPFLLVGDAHRGKSLRGGGRLCDIAPTLLPILELNPHPLMQGADLCSP